MLLVDSWSPAQDADIVVGVAVHRSVSVLAGKQRDEVADRVQTDSKKRYNKAIYHVIAGKIIIQHYTISYREDKQQI